MTLRFKRPDRKNALSLLESAKKEMRFTLSLKINEDSGSTIIRNVYECFRKLGDALLASKGIQTYDHIEPIKALLNQKVLANRPLGVIENLRQIRHNINYYGYIPRIEEVNDVISIARELFDGLLNSVKQDIESNSDR